MTEKKTAKKPAPKKTAKIEENIPAIVIDPKGKYLVEALEGNRHLKSGQAYEVTGVMAEILIKKGSVKLLS